LIGAVLACAGCLLSLIATEVWHLALTYGALTGEPSEERPACGLMQKNVQFSMNQTKIYFSNLEFPTFQRATEIPKTIEVLDHKKAQIKANRFAFS
jgi:hypothetical protein